jgi:hypothetical protein
MRPEGDSREAMTDFYKSKLDSKLPEGLMDAINKNVTKDMVEAFGVACSDYGDKEQLDR